jgi:hypothetical protein
LGRGGSGKGLGGLESVRGFALLRQKPVVQIAQWVG